MKLIPTIPELKVVEVPAYPFYLGATNSPRRDSYLPESVVAMIERSINGVYIGEFSALAQPGWYTDYGFPCFYVENPDAEKGHQNYVGFRLNDTGGLGVFSMQWIKDKEITGVIADDGEVVISRYGRDFQRSKDDSVWVDGGWGCLRTNRADRLIRLKFEKSQLRPVFIEKPV